MADTLQYTSTDISKKKLKKLYKALIKPRLIEEKMLLLLRQGRISKWFSGIGQEAISVGCTMALGKEEKIFTMHRNLGVFTTREVPFRRLFAQWQGKRSGFTNGRDRSFHFGTQEYNIVGMISHLGPQLSLAAGAALAYKLKGEKKVSLAFTGEGGTSQGEFHEAMNVASVWKLPVIFVIENNGYGLSTPVNEQYACKTLSDRAAGYGMKSVTIDGNNAVEVFETIRKIRKEIINDPQPYMVECMTFRMRGHEEASGQKYVPKELIEEWAEKDPIRKMEAQLIDLGIWDKEEMELYSSEFKQSISDDLEVVFGEEDIDPQLDHEMKSVYKDHSPGGAEITIYSDEEIRFIDAISDGLDHAMSRHQDLVIMGQDIAEYGGVFKITEGMLDKYGKDRIRNTPLCESAILGIALGLSIEGIKSVVEMQFADFVTCGFNQIVNNLAKLHYRWGQNADVVIRMPTGAGVGAGPFHSQSNEAWFFHVPGIKIVYPSNPVDAKGLITAAVEDPNPVMYFEHKALYRKITGKVPEGYYTTEIGKAALARSGNDISIITYGMGVHWALDVVDEMGIDADILDLRTLAPLDYNAIEETVCKTGKVLILHEDNLTGGIGGEISAYITEHLFDYLDGPVMRVASLDTPVPFAKALEDQYLPVNTLREKLQLLLNY
jgi:2-oxoisovalerate dehydrogenase E1 component